MQSGLKMQRIQPQMDAIKEKYKKYKVTDPKRNEMNMEIMQLQKDNGVNMFGGCIPTLDHAAAAFRVLHHAAQRRRAASRALVLAARPARSPTRGISCPSSWSSAHS